MTISVPPQTGTRADLQFVPELDRGPTLEVDTFDGVEFFKGDVWLAGRVGRGQFRRLSDVLNHTPTGLLLRDAVVGGLPELSDQGAGRDTWIDLRDIDLVGHTAVERGPAPQDERISEHIAKKHFSTLMPFSEFRAKELASQLATGSDLNAIVRFAAPLARIFMQYGLTLAEINPLAQLEDGSFIALDSHCDMEEEARDQQSAVLDELGIGREETRLARPPTEFEIRGAEVDASDHRGVAGRVVEFDGNLGCVIGAGGGSLTIFDALRKHGGKPANYCEIGGNPSVKKACELTKLILSKPGVEKICVIMNVVSNTRVDIVARGVIKGVVESGYDPAEKIAIFRIPGSWEEEGYKILEKYGVDYADRTVPMSEAARRAVEKVKA